MASRPGLSVVVPCRDESSGIAQLQAALRRLQRALRARGWQAEFLLVDDASRDDTLARLRAAFAGDAAVRVLHHPRNLGVAGAIQTGLRAARHPLCASIDADCSYDPLLLVDMLALLDEDTALVTASPYHPRGAVEGVPAWRLALSRAASLAYGALLRNRLHCYTSCFRLYRRAAVADQRLCFTGFAGVPELLWRVDRQGLRCREYPATLRRRRFGQSKLRLARAVGEHLRLLGLIAIERSGMYRFFTKKPFSRCLRN